MEKRYRSEDKGGDMSGELSWSFGGQTQGSRWYLGGDPVGVAETPLFPCEDGLSLLRRGLDAELYLYTPKMLNDQRWELLLDNDPDETYPASEHKMYRTSGGNVVIYL